MGLNFISSFQRQRTQSWWHGRRCKTTPKAQTGKTSSARNGSSYYAAQRIKQYIFYAESVMDIRRPWRPKKADCANLFSEAYWVFHAISSQCQTRYNSCFAYELVNYALLSAVALNFGVTLKQLIQCRKYWLILEFLTNESLGHRFDVLKLSYSQK